MFKMNELDPTGGIDEIRRETKNPHRNLIFNINNAIVFIDLKIFQECLWQLWLFMG